MDQLMYVKNVYIHIYVHRKCMKGYMLKYAVYIQK